MKYKRSDIYGDFADKEPVANKQFDTIRSRNFERVTTFIDVPDVPQLTPAEVERMQRDIQLLDMVKKLAKKTAMKIASPHDHTGQPLVRHLTPEQLSAMANNKKE